MCRPFLTLLTSAIALLGTHANAAIYRVGTGAGCTHASIAEAIAAAEANPGPDEIRISRSLSYTAQALGISTSQELNLHGGYSTCAQEVPDVPDTTISGAGGSAAPVFNILGGASSTIRLRRLFITNGDTAGTGHGGAIHYRGSGRLELYDSQPVSSIAGYGGGIYAEGLGPDAELVFGANVIVSGNTARYSGGGVYADSIKFSMAAPGSAIRFNEAQGTSDSGFGGGLIVLAKTRSATALVGSSGLGTQGTIFGNEARYGGGVALVSDGDGQHAILHVYGTDPGRRTSITDNLASVVGGGLYARPRSGVLGLGYAAANLWNADLIRNVAPDGAAAYLEDDSSLIGQAEGGRVYINSVFFEPPGGTLPCPEEDYCGRVVGNQTRSNGAATAGAIFRLRREATLHVHSAGLDASTLVRGGALIRDNGGGRLIDSDRWSSVLFDGVFLRNSAIHDNNFSLDLIRAVGGGDVMVVDSTIAQNSLGAAQVLSVNGDFRMERSLLWQPGKTSLVHSGGSRAVQFTQASEAASLGAPGAIQIAGPRFIDPDNGDLRLRAASPAIDFAPPVPGDDRDALGLPRDQRLAGVPRPEGLVRDVGAFERQTLQPLVLNGEFNIDLNHWQPIAGVTATWDGSQNAAGIAGSGSLFVNEANIPDPRVTVRRQCIHLPGPGRYRLNGWGRSGIGTPATRDAVLLHWVLRHDGGEACDTGPPNASGEHFLTTANAWTRPELPAEIAISAADWRNNSSLVVSLVVIDRGTTAPPTATGWFDGITLEFFGLDDVILSDGFE